MLLNKRPPFIYILNKVRLELIYVSVTTLIVYYLTSRFDHLVPEIPLTIPTFLGTAISVILLFKLSQPYDRWGSRTIFYKLIFFVWYLWLQQ
jgi:putative membrane protein